MHRGEALRYLIELGDELVDAVITDPPYSSGGLHQAARNQSPAKKYVQTGTRVVRPDFTGDNRDQRSYGFWSTLWLGEALRIARPGAVAAVFTDWRQLPVTTDALQAAGWIWRGIVVWDKTEGARPQKGSFRNQSEYVVWGSKGPLDRGASAPVLNGVFRHAVRRTEKHHLTGKPTDLMSNLVEICAPGGTVLDPFMGSGTTGVAAVRSGRGFIGCELSHEYFTVASARIADECAGGLAAAA